MIQKPKDEDFRESRVVATARTTSKIAVEGSKGIGAGVGRLYLYWIGGMMLFGLVVSAIPYIGFWGFLLLASGGIFWWRDYRKQAAARIEGLRQQPQRFFAAAPVCDPAVAFQSQAPSPFANGSDDGGFAFPAHVRREAKILFDIGQATQQAAVLLAAGLFFLFVLGRALENVGTIMGIVLVMLSVLVASRLLGDRVAIEWTPREVTVHHLLSTGTMQWADVDDVTVEKSSKLNFKTYFQSGSSKNIVLRAPINRLGGPTEMRVPVRLLGMEKAELERLLADLFCWRAAGNTLSPTATQPSGYAQPSGRPSSPGSQEIAAEPLGTSSPSADSNAGFDPDAIIERHLAERRRLFAENRPPVRSNSERVSPPAGVQMATRPTFGRKRI